MIDATYYVREWRGEVTVAKMVDEDVVVYHIKKNQCDCPGCVYHKTQCKHLRIKKVWEFMGKPQSAAFVVSEKGDVSEYRPTKIRNRTKRKLSGNQGSDTRDILRHRRNKSGKRGTKGPVAPEHVSRG